MNRLAISALFALPLLTGCETASIQAQYIRSGIADSYRLAAAQGFVPVIVRGNPFAVSDAAVAAAVAEASRGTYGGIWAPFAVSSATSGVRVVWHLSATPRLSGYDLCAQGAPMPAQADGRRILGALCSGALVLSEVTAVLPTAPAGPQDAQWRRVFPDALASLVPISDPFEDLGP